MHDFPARRWQYDVALYQMGNSMHHEQIYRMMQRYPGITVLHDNGLHHFLAHRAAALRNYTLYVREMGFALGREGIREAWAIRHGGKPHRFGELPLTDRVVALSLAVVVHNEEVAAQLRRKHPHKPVFQVPAVMTKVQAQTQREKLPWPAGTIVFASVGEVTPAKQVARALRAFARLREQLPHVGYLVIGEEADGGELDAVIAELGLADAVWRTGFVPDLALFAGWIEAADVVVNLRAPTLGETSAAALRALVAGRPLVVYDHGWYAELPNAVAIKVPPLDDEALVAAFRALATDRTRREEMGRQASTYVNRFHTPEAAAAALMQVVDAVLNRTGNRTGTETT